MRRKQQEIGIGIVGMGFMGTTHLRAASALRDGRVVAIATADPRKARGDFRRVRGNFGGAGGRLPLQGIHVHRDLDSLLGDEDVDLVDVCLPSFLHRAATLQSLRAGKHVLVEKPLALDTRQGEKMIASAGRAGRLLMVGQVLKFFPEFALLASAVHDERWGKLLALHLRRLISMPDWGGGSWFSRPEKSGGMVVDLHIHDTDFVGYLFGKPTAVTSSGLLRHGRVDFIRTVYHHGTPGHHGAAGHHGVAGAGRVAPLVSSEAGWINAPALPFEHGYDAFFERGTCHYNSACTPRPVLHDGKGRRVLKLRAADGFQDELQAAVNAVQEGRAPASLSAGAALISLKVCLAEEKSARAGKRVKV